MLRLIAGLGRFLVAMVVALRVFGRGTRAIPRSLGRIRPPQVKVEVRGLRELEHNLKMLEREVSLKLVRRAMSKAAVPMRDDARRRAPVLAAPDPRRRPGTVRNAIRITRARRTPYTATYLVGVRALSRRAIAKFKRQPGAKAADNPNDPFYWRFIEFGTSKVPPRPFLRPAFEARKMESVAIARDELAAGIRKVAAGFKRLR